ncbi:MAG TPA: hypothetical protein VEJ63_17660 [Planctomycetota bacterium]|nr:hypothetical protein [Planctomycetota bacterium]
MIKLLLLLFIALVIVAVKFLPWYALIAIALLAIICFKYFVRYLFLMPFKMKSAALHGATLQVHSVTPTAKPQKEKSEDGDEDDSEEEAPDQPRDYFVTELTITPKAGADGKFTHWEPGELLLSVPGKNPMDETESSDDIGEIGKLEVFEDGAFKVDEGMKYPDAQRLRMVLGVKPGLREVQLNYYFETLGTIKLK